jgi:hypothetical protein
MDGWLFSAGEDVGRPIDYLGYGRNLPIQEIGMSFFDKKQLTEPASVRFG